MTGTALLDPYSPGTTPVLPRVAFIVSVRH